MGLMGELEQLVRSPLSCSNSFCQSSCCLCLQVYVFFWSLEMDWKILVQLFRKLGSWYWKVFLPVILSILQGEWQLKFTSGKLSGNTGVFCWLPAVCSAGFLQCFPCSFQLGPMQLQQTGEYFIFVVATPLWEEVWKQWCVFWTIKPLGFYYLFITSFRVLGNKGTL